MKMDVSYGISRRLDAKDLDSAKARITAALQAEGFGVLTEIDVRATLEKKLGVETPPYLILGACNPRLAHGALQVEPGVGLLLPCNIVLTTDDKDGVIVSAASPKALFASVGSAGALADFAAEAEAKIRRAVAAA